MTFKRLILGATVLLASTLSMGVSQAAVIGADWTNTSGGTIDGIGFTALGFGSQYLAISTQSYTSADFSAAPIASTEAIDYGANDDWSLTFDAPISELFLYVDVWRGPYNVGITDPTTSYTFNLPFTVASGLSGAGVAGNTLSLPDNGDFYNGILRFVGPITALSVDSQGALNASGQRLTFSTPQRAPEPGTWAMLALGLLAFSATRTRRASRREP